MEDVKRIRRRLSRRLENALKAGRLRQERERIEQNAERAFTESTQARKNGKRRK